MSDKSDAQALTIRQTAEYLQLHPLTIRKMVQNGVLPAAKNHRGEWRIDRAELQRWIIERTRENSASSMG